MLQYRKYVYFRLTITPKRQCSPIMVDQLSRYSMYHFLTYIWQPISVCNYDDLLYNFANHFQPLTTDMSHLTRNQLLDWWQIKHTNLIISTKQRTGLCYKGRRGNVRLLSKNSI